MSDTFDDWYYTKYGSYPAHESGPRYMEWMKEQLAVLREKCAELEKDVQVAKGQYEGACDIIAELQRKLDGYEQAAKQEPVVEVRDNPDDYGFVYEWISESVLPWPGLKLYAAPANLPALIEQAKAGEWESALKVMRHAAAALAHAAESNPLYQDAYNEIDAAIRARKP